MAPLCDLSSAANGELGKPAPMLGHVQGRSPYKSHENEDMRGIPGQFYDKRLLNPEPFDAKSGPFMHKALHVSKMTGKRKLQVVKERSHLYSIGGRMESYSAEADTEWLGAPAKKMAEAGLSRKDRSNFAAECLYCGVTLRFRDAESDPLALHKAMSPNCKYIRMLREHGTSPQAEEGGKRRRSSYSSFQALTKESEE